MTESERYCPDRGTDTLQSPEHSLPSSCESGGRQAKPEVMTEAQRQFAADRHSLIYAYLREKRLEPRDYYDIAALGFIRAVMRYFQKPNLRLYSFTTIAWRAMDQEISSYLRSELRRQECEKRYIQTVPAQTDPYSTLEEDWILQDLFSMSSEEQQRLASMRLQGYSIAETAHIQGMSSKRVRKLLRELYQVYLKLYK